MIKNKINLVYKELSYEIIGVLFRVFNELGYGYNEKYYERAVFEALKDKGVKVKRQVPADLKFGNKIIGEYYLDFLIEDKIILELKVGKRFAKQAFEQIISYLKTTKKKLGILVLFTNNGVRYIRILNFKNRFDTAEAEIKLINTRKLIKF